jgi:DNA-binding GntR family transcriptional regulator
MAAADSEETSKARNGASLVDLARETILRGILNHRFAGGDVLQESKLALALGLSRTPVREALGRLEGEGLLVRNGRLLMVRSIQVREYIEIIYVLRNLEAEAAALATGSVSESKLRQIRLALDASADPAATPPEMHRALDDEIHTTIAEASRNQQLSTLITDLRRKAQLFDAGHLANRWESGRMEHVAIVDALLRGDSEAAREAMRVHLENTKRGILDQLREY